ncbi:MAG: hypothetical protein IPH84_10990 [Bacteroidales bacterium]|nr:hypothetical protein [Bacteroidales bacterium]
MEIIGKTGNDQKFNGGIDAGFIGVNGYVEIPLKGKRLCIPCRQEVVQVVPL